VRRDWDAPEGCSEVSGREGAHEFVGGRDRVEPGGGVSRHGVPGRRPRVDVHAAYRSAVAGARSVSRGVRRHALRVPDGLESAQRTQTREVNEAAQAQLEAELTALGLPFLRGEGVDPSGSWPGEPSVLVLGITEEEARRLGRRYGQNAIVVAGRDAVARLVMLDGEPRGCI
jgi:hypothetical protein